MKDLQDEIGEELRKAADARKRGNEGQARVLARRAAGIAVREYYARRGEKLATPSAYDLLRRLAEDPSIPGEMREMAGSLVLRVNEEFKLPVDVDLLDEARKLSAGLLQ